MSQGLKILTMNNRLNGQSAFRHDKQGLYSLTTWELCTNFTGGTLNTCHRTWTWNGLDHLDPKSRRFGKIKSFGLWLVAASPLSALYTSVSRVIQLTPCSAESAARPEVNGAVKWSQVMRSVSEESADLSRCPRCPDDDLKLKPTISELFLAPHHVSSVQPEKPCSAPNVHNRYVSMARINKIK